MMSKPRLARRPARYREPAGRMPRPFTLTSMNRRRAGAIVCAAKMTQVVYLFEERLLDVGRRTTTCRSYLATALGPARARGAFRSLLARELPGGRSRRAGGCGL